MRILRTPCGAWSGWRSERLGSLGAEGGEEVKRYANPEESFLSRTYPGPNGCLLWRGAHGHGYPRISINRKSALASRYAWERVNGPIPSGLFVCHKCDNPGCVNVEHLFLGTQKDNMSDASRKGRVRVPRLEGEACAASKLTEPQVRKIREEFGSGVSNKEIARRYEIPWQTIADVTSRRSWKCVE